MAKHRLFIDMLDAAVLQTQVQRHYATSHSKSKESNMPGGKQKLNQLFTSRLEVSESGVGTVLTQILSGSATITGGCGVSACGARIDGGLNSCVIGEITVSDLNPCDMMIATVWGTTACLMYKGEVLL